jgi:hypothetical protein
MFELPDRRAIFILAVVIVVGLVSFAVPTTSALATPIERLLFLTIAGAGLAFTVLDLREGYCMNRPSITREETPLFFWFEVLASILMVCIGMYKLWQLV